MQVNLANAILRAPGETFPYRKSPLDLKSYDLQGLATNRFDNFHVAKLHNNLTMYVGDPTATPAETQAQIQTEFSGLFYLDKNSDKSYDPAVDTKMADVRLFVSKDGAYLLRQYGALSDSLRPDEIAIFLELPDDDLISSSVMLIKAGANAKKYAATVLQHDFVADQFALSPDQVQQLLKSLSSGQSLWEQAVAMMVSIRQAIVRKVAELGAKLFDVIADFFHDNLRIPERYWNAGDPEYGFGKVADAIEEFFEGYAGALDGFVQEYADYLPEWAVNILSLPGRILRGMLEAMQEFRDLAETLFAFICGLWNGLIDLVAAIFTLIRLLFDGIGAANRYKSNENFYNALAIEYVDNFLQAILKVDWIAVARGALRAYGEHLIWMAGIPAKLMEKLAEVNHTEVGYYLGYILFQVLELLFPPLKIAKLSQVAKLEKVVVFFGEISGKVVKGAKTVGKAAQKTAKGIAEVFFELVEGFIRKLQEGTAAFRRWIDEIFASIKRYLDEVMEGFFKTSDEVGELYRSRTLAADGSVVLRRGELGSIARKLEQRYRAMNLKVEILSDAPRFRTRMKKWKERGTLGSFDAGPPPVIYLRHPCSKLTVQHELWHLEDLQRLGHEAYRKIPNWKHEESVWTRIWATKDEWTEKELLDSYEYYKTKVFKIGGNPSKIDELETLIR